MTEAACVVGRGRGGMNGEEPATFRRPLTALKVVCNPLEDGDSTGVGVGGRERERERETRRERESLTALKVVCSPRGIR